MRSTDVFPDDRKPKAQPETVHITPDSYTQTLVSDPSAPLASSIPRADIVGQANRLPLGSQKVHFPNDALARLPVTWTSPTPTTSTDTGHTVNPQAHDALTADSPTLTGPDRSLPSKGKTFASPPQHTVPAQGGRLDLTPRRTIPEQRPYATENALFRPPVYVKEGPVPNSQPVPAIRGQGFSPDSVPRMAVTHVTPQPTTSSDSGLQLTGHGGGPAPALDSIAAVGSQGSSTLKFFDLQKPLEIGNAPPVLSNRLDDLLRRGQPVGPARSIDRDRREET